MNKKYTLCLLCIISSICFTSCDNTSKSEISSYLSSTKRTETLQKLQTSTDLIKQSMYDSLDLSSLTISLLTYENNELTKSEIVSSYSLFNLTSNKEIKADDILLDSGIFTIQVSYKELKTSFTLQVGVSNNFEQKIIINSKPTKTKYKINDSFSSSGLSLSLYTSYLDSSNNLRKLITPLTNYSLSIENEDVASFKYEENRLYRVDISTSGYKETITTSFSTYCLKDSYSPIDNNDKTLMEEETSLLHLSITNPNKEKVEVKGYFAPSEVDVSNNIHKVSNTNFYSTSRYTPSIGKVPLLVIPIVLPTYESLATNENYIKIQKAFNGTSSDLNFESLHSYYYKSSYGQLDFQTTITDYYYLASESSKFNTLNSIEKDIATTTISNLGNDAVNWAKNIYNLDLKEYDYDNNGLIDGVWLVYMHPYETRGSLYWAMSGFNNAKGDKENPQLNTYGWISNDFINGEYSHNPDSNPDKGLDAHTLIHETGHMLGLADYYDANRIDEESINNAPLGNIDIMDNNIGDQNPYSKLLLGWISPYVIYNEAVIDLKSFQSKNQVILIPKDSKNKKDYTIKNNKAVLNIFDEYLLLDFYTPYGLNELDYPSYDIKTVKESGLRIYHVDNRLGKVTFNGDTPIINILENPDEYLNTSNQDYYKVITNSIHEVYTDTSKNSFDEVRWISTNKTKFNINSDNQNRIFKVGETFKIEEDDNNFINGLFNSKEKCSYQISVINQK